MRPLAAILARHQATLTCQFDAFASYVAEAEREGVGHYPLYEWTKKIIKDPAKKGKYLQVFTFYIEGHEVYPKARAEALVADLQPLVNAGLITRVAQYDTNPAKNPQPPARSAT